MARLQTKTARVPSFSNELCLGLFLFFIFSCQYLFCTFVVILFDCFLFCWWFVLVLLLLMFFLSLSPLTQAPLIWRWLGRIQMLSLKAFLTAYIRNATPSVWTWYFPKQPLRMTALSDQVLEVIIKGGASIDERLSKLVISSLWRRLQNTVVWCVLAWFISKLPAHVARPSPKYPDKHLHS